MKTSAKAVAKPSIQAPKTTKRSVNEDDQFSKDLVKHLNKKFGERLAYNLETDSDAPTNVKRWLSTGSVQLDYAIANIAHGGYPEGRIIEVQGPTSIGKSHISYELIKSAQRMGGRAMYIDTENATSRENLLGLGIDTGSRLIFVQESQTERIFSIIEEAILLFSNAGKSEPFVIIWDSLAGSSPKAELEGEYEQNTIGLQARVLSKGMRKITNVIGDQNALLFLVNQQREKIGVMYGDNCLYPEARITVRRAI